MHIGFISSHFPFHDAKSVGGIGTSIKNLSDELVGLGHRVSVFVYGQEIDDDFINEGVCIYKIKNIKVKGISWFLTRKKIQRVIKEVNEKNKIDIIEAPDWEGITAFVKLDLPIVIRLNGSDTYFCHLDKRKVKFRNFYIEKTALKQADGIISVSQFTGKVTNEIFKLNKKITVIPNGININNFEPTSDFDDKKVILYFGGIIRKKGLLEIPHYFNLVNKYCPEARLVLIGQDMYDISTGNISTFKMMEPLFEDDVKSKVSFLGSVPYHEIKDHIEKATVCIFPSYAEALPVSWLEAMAQAKAVVASNIGWSNEIIDDSINGFKVHPKEHELFADRICQLLSDAGLREKMEKNARLKIIEKFSTKITAQKSVAFYKEIIEKYND